jgi:hypothetical protein
MELYLHCRTHSYLVVLIKYRDRFTFTDNVYLELFSFR